MMEVGRAPSLGGFNIEGVPWRVDAIVGFCIFRPLLKKVADRKIFDLCLGRHADVEEIFRRRQHIRQCFSPVWVWRQYKLNSWWPAGPLPRGDKMVSYRRS